MTLPECCKEYEELIGGSLAGELNADEKRRLNEHLIACRSCRAAHDGLAKFRGRLLPAWSEAEKHSPRHISRPALAAMLVASFIAAILIWRGESSPRAAFEPTPMTTLAAALPAETDDVIVLEEDLDLLSEDELVEMLSDEEVNEMIISLQTGKEGVTS